MLLAYARGAALERRASEELMASVTVGNAPLPWLTVHAGMVRSLTQLTLRLRLGPRSREPNYRRHAAKSRPPSSYYDLMAWRANEEGCASNRPEAC